MLSFVFLALVMVGLYLFFIFVWRQPNAPQTPRPSQNTAPSPGSASNPAYALVHNTWENGRGYTMVRQADGQKLAWSFLPKKEGFQCLEVVGESYHQKDLQQPGFAAGFPIKLVAEPENPVDHDAVAVRDASGKYQAGYLSRDDAPKILKRIENGGGFRALVMWEVNIGGQRVSLRLLLMDKGTSLNLSVPDESLSAWESYLKAPASAK